MIPPTRMNPTATIAMLKMPPNSPGSSSGAPTQSFTTEDGKTFVVANYPHAVPVGSLVEVEAYPLQRPPVQSSPSAPSLWITLARR